jgi:Nif-specific regulatory protein
MSIEQNPTDEACLEAFLVTREDGSWREVFRLVPGQVVTVGRGPDNRIIVRDDRCSRRHCDFYEADQGWHVRDLESRNGTSVNGNKIAREYPLADGDVIRIGVCEMLFTTDISRPLDRFLKHDGREPAARDTEEASPPDREPEILESASENRYFTEKGLAADAAPESTYRGEVARLFRLGLRMQAAANIRELADVVLEELQSKTGADIGALLEFAESPSDRTDPQQLRIVSYNAPEDTPYHKISRSLSNRVLQQGEAVLAMDVGRHSGTTEFKTLSEIHAQSVICAPIRLDGRVLGLLHLYSLSMQKALDVEALGYALAVADHLARVLHQLRENENLTDVIRREREQKQSLTRLLEFESDFVGESPEMQRLREEIARVAASDAVVLVRGESGVGKELAARAVHFNSSRRDGPFVCLNCAALTETLLESELFGHEKGAFTGATDCKVGKFERADGGTLFLDEVGEMPLAIQTKFLRVLEGHAFERVGGNLEIRVDVRGVAATNRDLEEAVEKGTFRKDLFFRLHILDIVVPPLREHPTDIAALAEFFLERCCRRIGRAPKHYAPEALQLLRQHDWPGNVRELRNVVERAVVLADGQEILPRHIRFSSKFLPAAWLNESLAWGYEEMSLDDVERIHITRTMQYTDWKKREAARILGINRSTLDRKLERYQIQPPQDH